MINFIVTPNGLLNLNTRPISSGSDIMQQLQPESMNPFNVNELREALDNLESQPLTTNRSFTLHTGPAGFEQFNQAMREAGNRELTRLASLPESELLRELDLLSNEDV